MNQKKTSIILGIGLAVLIGGAVFLYQKLGDEYDSKQLATMPPVTDVKPEQEEAVAEEAVAEEAVAEENAQAQRKEDDKTMAPDFGMYDKEGNPVKLSDYFGKPVIMNFWASWCGPCKSEMPDFQEAYTQYGEEIHFLMINLTDGQSETKESASAFIQGSGYTFPIYFDADQEAAMTYGVYSIPTTFFLDENGYMIAYAQGAIEAEVLQQGIDMIYAQ